MAEEKRADYLARLEASVLDMGKALGIERAATARLKDELALSVPEEMHKTIVAHLEGATRELVIAVKDVLPEMNYYIGPNARTAVSSESVARYRRLVAACEVLDA